jgi:hypothetical protein
MGTTPNYALPYPEPTDLVKDGAQAIEDLALAVDSAITAASQNAIINGNMMVAQRGTSFTSTGGANNDDTYTLDRWYILSDGNDAIDVTQSTNAPTGGLNSIALDVETINKKFGIAQIIEQKNCIGLIGQTVTLSFKARVSSTTKLDNVKAAIVAWSGTADTVTSDIVSAWGVEGTNPTLIANATYENTPANLNVTTSWASYSVTAPVDTASTNNIIVFIWSDVTDTTLGDFLYVTDVQLEYGSVPTRFAIHGGGIDGEISACQRYYQRYNFPVATGAGLISGVSVNTTIVDIIYIPPSEFRIAPTSIDSLTPIIYYPSTGASYSSGTFTITSFTTRNSVIIRYTHGSGVFTAGLGGFISSSTNNGYIGLTAEL